MDPLDTTIDGKPVVQAWTITNGTTAETLFLFVYGTPLDWRARVERENGEVVVSVNMPQWYECISEAAAQAFRSLSMIESGDGTHDRFGPDGD